MFAKNFPPNSGSGVVEVSSPCIFRSMQLPLLMDFWKSSNREINASFISFSASAQDTKGFLQHLLCLIAAAWEKYEQMQVLAYLQSRKKKQSWGMVK